MAALITVLGFLGLTMILVLYSSFTSGFVLYKFIGWFLLPVIGHDYHFTYLQCVGLVVLLSVIKSSNTSDLYLKGDKIERKPDFGSSLLKPWLLLLIGWFVHLFL